MSRIRTLRHGEQPPEGVEPRRYKNVHGYMRLRWRCPDGSLVECYEHRWVMGNPPSHVQVHHINHVRDDNRPENLRVVTPSEHGVEHRTIDRQEARRLYLEERMTTPEIGEALGCNAAAVYRALRGDGVEMRSVAEALTIHDDDLPEWEVRKLYEAGASSRRLANLYGVSPSAIDSRLRAWGINRRPGGRQTAAMRAAGERAIRDAVAGVLR